MIGVSLAEGTLSRCLLPQLNHPAATILPAGPTVELPGAKTALSSDWPALLESSVEPVTYDFDQAPATSPSTLPRYVRSVLEYLLSGVHNRSCLRPLLSLDARSRASERAPGLRRAQARQAPPPTTMEALRAAVRARQRTEREKRRKRCLGLRRIGLGMSGGRR